MTKQARRTHNPADLRTIRESQAAHLPKERQEQQGEHPRRQKGDGDMGRFPDHPFRRYEPGKHRQAQDRVEQNFSAIRLTVCRHCSASPACCQSMPPQ